MAWVILRKNGNGIDVIVNGKSLSKVNNCKDIKVTLGSILEQLSK